MNWLIIGKLVLFLPMRTSFRLGKVPYIVGNVISMILTGRFGRRTILFNGLWVMTLLMFVIGFLSLAPNSNTNIAWAQSAIWLLSYCFEETSIGPVPYIIISEVSSTRLRGKTIALGRNAYQIVNILNSCVSPYILHPTEGNWKGKTAFLTGGLCVPSCLWTFFRLPELKGRTYEEADILFQKRLSARRFQDYEVDPYAEDAGFGIVVH